MKSPSPHRSHVVHAVFGSRAWDLFRVSAFQILASCLLWEICTLVFASGNVSRGAVAAFEDLVLAPESYWNGDDGSGGFVSGDASFENHYSAEWEFWDGFAYSNRTDANGTGYEAQYNAIPGGGQGGSANYAVAFVGWEAPPTLTFAHPQRFTGLYVANNCYAYYDMRDGSPFSKKFGGDTGDDEDWFKLTITGIDANDLPAGVVEFYLADFRFADNARDYILDSWAFVDLAPLGEVQTLQFTLSSSDTGGSGMNTPAYLCLDTIVTGIADAPDAEDEQAGVSTAAPGEILSGDNSCQGK